MQRALISSALLAALVASACSPTPEGATPSAHAAGGPALTSPSGVGARGVGISSRSHAALVATIDSIALAPIKEGKVAGLSIAAVHGADTIAIKGYGWADLELDVPTPEQAIYEIGSVTKQFTAAAVLKLEDDGKLHLDDAIGKYLPDFPTRGHRITVRQLLDHTSGIRGYTEIRDARPLFVQRMPRDSLVALFAKHDFDFPTGEQMIYNNSAYYLAGMIIEKVSGQSYEDYVEKQIFEPLGMDDSHYCSEREIHPGKVHGYEADSSGLVHKGFLVHNIPYAAGSLCSTAWDLVTWLNALHGGRVVSQASYQKMIAPAKLKDGTRLRYGLGLALTDIAGHRAIHHGGGINGFLTQTIYFPDEDLRVAVVMNTAGPPGPDAIAEAIAKAVIGEGERPAASYDGDLAQFAGTFAGPARAVPLTLQISAEGEGVLTALRIGPQGPAEEAKPDTLRFVEGQTFAMGGALLTFEGNKLRFDVGYGHSILRRK